MSPAFGTCPKHHIQYRGRCPKCHPRRSSSSRPISGRRQHALITERLVRFDRPQAPQAPQARWLTTADAARHVMDRYGIASSAELTDTQVARLLAYSSTLADRWNRRFHQTASELVR